MDNNDLITKTLCADGVQYYIYKKSIEVVGIGIFYFSHRVKDSDVVKLHRLYQLGKESKMK